MRQSPYKSGRFSTSNRILLALIVVAFIFALISGFEDGQFQWRGLVGNLASELIGAVITYAIIERIVHASADNADTKRQLIRKLENPHAGAAITAVQELYARGWLQDGSLYGWFLKRANLEKADLRKANTNELGLYRCNLTDALINENQLAVMSDLRRTIMPDGQPYDGRYCLKGDLNWARTNYGIDVNEATPQQMADYYNVPLERYLEGQKWAKANLERLGRDIPLYLQRKEF
jgi:uncharacterized protein YjbI with pentapeptide repeats